MSALNAPDWLPSNWTKRYRYAVEHCFGSKIATGTVQVSREMTGEEILKLVKTMSNAITYDAKLISYELIESR